MATRPADNPVGLVARKLHLGGVAKEAPKLSLPGKLVFPSIHNTGHFSMLGNYYKNYKKILKFCILFFFNLNFLHITFFFKFSYVKI